MYLVVAVSQGRVAKVYKEAEHCSFVNRAVYTEVDMIYRLRQAGVRVPEPYLFVDGVLIWRGFERRRASRRRGWGS